MKIILIILIVSSVLQVFKPKIKGFFGEKKVSSRIKRLPENDYRMLNDIYLRTDRGTSQIDHIVISVYGIFVIETKIRDGS